MKKLDDVKKLDDRSRRAFACWTVAMGLLPYYRDKPSAAIPNDPRSRWLRALEFLVLFEGESTSDSAAARAAGIKRGTVASWLSRDPDFANRAAARRERAAWEIASLKEDPLDPSELEALDRILRLPEVELVRVEVGEVPSRRLMRAAFPASDDGGSSEDYPNWLETFPR